MTEAFSVADAILGNIGAPLRDGSELDFAHGDSDYESEYESNVSSQSVSDLEVATGRSQSDYEENRRVGSIGYGEGS